MVSALLFDPISIILATVQHYWKYILWFYSNSKNTALAMLKDTRMTSFPILHQIANDKKKVLRLKRYDRSWIFYTLFGTREGAGVADTEQIAMFTSAVAITHVRESPDVA